MSMSATEKVPASHSRPAKIGSRCWSRALRNSSKRFHFFNRSYLQCQQRTFALTPMIEVRPEAG
jgi:hypothetical protein